MKVLRVILVTVLSLVLIGVAGYLYVSSGIKSEPGYTQFALPSSIKGKPVNSLLAFSIGPRGIKLLQWILEKVTQHVDLELEAEEFIFMSTLALQELHGAQLRIYEFQGKQQAFDNAITDSVASLKKKNWQTLVQVRDEDQLTAIMQLGNDEQIDGLSVMVSTSDNAVFLNLIGPFDPEMIANQLDQEKWRIQNERG